MSSVSWLFSLLRNEVWSSEILLIFLLVSIRCLVKTISPEMLGLSWMEKMLTKCQKLFYIFWQNLKWKKYQFENGKQICHLIWKFICPTLQMFAGNYRDSTGKSECRDFKFMGIACIPATPVTFKTHTLISIVIFEGNLILQGYYGDSLH